MTSVASSLDPWAGAWDDDAMAALDAIETSIHRGDTTGALGLIRSIRRRLREPDPVVSPDRFRLTERELTALVLLPDATLSQKDIARAMGITHNTLKTHLRSLYQKLGAHSRAEAIELGGFSRPFPLAV